MPIARLLYITVAPDRTDEAMQVWREKCSTLMTSSPGCLNERLLRSTEDPGQLISYSEWESMEAIEQYRGSEAHAEIKEHSRPLADGNRPVIKLFDVVD